MIWVNIQSLFKFWKKKNKLRYSFLSKFRVLVMQYLVEKHFLPFFSQNLTHFMPLVFLYTPWKHQKTSAFLMFSGGIERDQWHEIGLVVSFRSLWSSFILRNLTSRVFSKRYCALMLKNMFGIFFYVPCKLWKRLNGKGLFV